MDDTKKRNISEQALEKVIRNFNLSLLESLPAKPKEILEFAKRRTDPIISKNIDQNLAAKMISHRLSDEDYLKTLFASILFAFSGKEKVENPSASILLAQTGAGKTNLRTLLMHNEPNTVTINADQYKKFRPDEKMILLEDSTHFGALTGIDSYDHASNITEFAIANGYNILVECAPSLQQGMVGIDFNTLNKANYNTKIHILAVGDLISALAIHLRYESDLQKQLTSGDVKLTDLKRHNESYLALEKSITGLNPAMILLYKRGYEENGNMPIEIPTQGSSPLEILRSTRTDSNKEYIEKGLFQLDYQSILVSMKKRNAPELQQQQLATIYEMYKNHLTKTPDCR